MNGTPQLRSAWPATPQSNLKRRPPEESPVRRTPREQASPKSDNPQLDKQPAVTFLDAPTQRFYVSTIYASLWLWRIYDFVCLPADKRDGFGKFTKWVGIDTAYLYGLSALNVPWLQWSSSTFTVLFIAHAALNWMLMFQIPVGGLQFHVPIEWTDTFRYRSSPGWARFSKSSMIASMRFPNDM